MFYVDINAMTAMMSTTLQEFFKLQNSTENIQYKKAEYVLARTSFTLLLALGTHMLSTHDSQRLVKLRLTSQPCRGVDLSPRLGDTQWPMNPPPHYCPPLI